MKKYAFGVDIGGTTIKAGLFENSGTLLEKWEIKTNVEHSGTGILEDIANTILNKMDEMNITEAQIEGVGLGVPGPVLGDGTVNRCVNLGWDVFNIEQELMGMLHEIPVKAGNDANVAALGEMWQGGGKGFENVVMVTLGTGVGGGIILGGRIVPGSFGAGGEIGHIQMKKDENQLCGCGKKGCLEQYASATGIVRKTQEVLEESKADSPLRSVMDLTAKDVFDAAKKGDEISLEIIDFVGEQLGTALSYISSVIDPQIYVIGGGVSKAGSILIDAIQKYFNESAFHASREAQIVLAELGNDAGMYGAVKLIFNN